MTLRPARSAIPALRLLPLALAPVWLLLGAAGPLAPAETGLNVQFSDPAPFGVSAAPSAVAPVKKPLGVTPAGLEPAPVPDPDVGGPLAGGLKGASLAPAFFSQKAEFAGDGFVGKSSADDTTERRRQPAAGFNLSVPVQQ